MNSLPIASIRMDGGTQPRTRIRDDWVEEYAGDMVAGATFPAVVVFYDGAEYWLADGFHRTCAAKISGKSEIAADIRQGTRRDAILFSVAANGQHGQRRTNDDKRRAVLTLLNDQEWSSWSDSEIARRCAVDHKTVAAYRQPILGNSQDAGTRTIQRNGTIYQQNTANIGRRPVEPFPEDRGPETLVAAFTSHPSAQDDLGRSPFSPSYDEPPFTCICGETFSREVWHCPTCDHHWLAEETQCRNCYRPRDAFDLEDGDLGAPVQHVRGTFGTGNNEWFTPAAYIQAARDVMGVIDLDPATHQVAQAAVQAARFFTQEDDGLQQAWSGRVWLNPPYAQPLIGQFVGKLVGELRLGAVPEAILLTHNYTDTEWFHTAEAACSLICFTRGRIRFVNPDGNECSPTQGQAFFYFGANVEQFRSVFSAFGFVR